jgi:hypothetical protein
VNAPGEARQWHEEACHLVQAHGADPARLTASVVTLGHARWLHFDAHAALRIAGLRPPDGHTHPALRDPGRPGQAPSFYRPFPPAPTGRVPLSRLRRYTAIPAFTGLPQTGVPPDTGEAEITDWAGAALGRLLTTAQARSKSGLELCELAQAFGDSLARVAAHFESDPGLVTAVYCNRLNSLADAAAARWLASTSFPPALARAGAAPARSGAQIQRTAPDLAAEGFPRGPAAGQRVSSGTAVSSRRGTSSTRHEQHRQRPAGGRW